MIEVLKQSRIELMNDTENSLISDSELFKKMNNVESQLQIKITISSSVMFYIIKWMSVQCLFSDCKCVCKDRRSSWIQNVTYLVNSFRKNKSSDLTASSTLIVTCFCCSTVRSLSENSIMTLIIFFIFNNEIISLTYAYFS